LYFSEKKEKGDDKEIARWRCGFGDECGGASSAPAGEMGGSVEKMKALVGDWQTETTNMQKATLRLELTSGGTALLGKIPHGRKREAVEMITLYYLDWRQAEIDALLHGRESADDVGKLRSCNNLSSIS